MKSLRHTLQHWSQDGRLYAILSAAGFSLKAIFVKLAYAVNHVDALTLLALRMGISLPFFVWLVWLGRGQQKGPVSRADAVRIFLLAMSGYYLSSLFDFRGLEDITAGLERMILFLYPTMVLLLQCVLSRRAPARRTIPATLVCYLGLGVAFVHDIHLAGHGGKILAGSAWVFASAVTYALYYIGTGTLLQRFGSTLLAGLAGAVSSLQVIAHFLLLGEVGSIASQPVMVWVYAALMAIVSTALPIYWLSLAIQRMGATQAAAVGNLGPVLTILASWLVLSEPLSIAQLAGLALVLLGVSLLKQPEKASSPKPDALGRQGAD